jgi:hypothetical protein
MSRAAIEAKLRDVTERIRRAREELAVLDEQLLVFRETADEARLQAIVDESPLSRSDSGEAQRHAEAHERSRQKAAAALAELERSRDDLLDRLVLESR